MKGRAAGSLLALLLGIWGCGPRTRASVFPSRRQPTSLRFVDATQPSGIKFRHFNGASGKKYFPEMMGSGAGWLDYDGDGDLDLYLVNGCALSLPGGFLSTGSPDSDASDALFRNEGGGVFTDVTRGSGMGDREYGMGLAVGDYDNDGFDDVYVTNFGACRLYRNNGDGTFSDRTRKARAGVSGFASSASFLDCDRDGALDLYVCRYVEYDLAHDIVCLNPAGDKQYCEISAFPGADDVLLRNGQNGEFRDDSRTAGVLGPKARGLALVCGDFDDDGDPDIFVANDRSGNLLWNNDGQGRFRDVALISGVQCDEHGRMPAGMGADTADANGDGKLDLYVSNYQFEPNLLFLGLGRGQFRDGTAEASLAEPAIPFLGFGVGFADFDLDGLRDLFVANGHVLDDVERFQRDVRFKQTPQVFRNESRGRYTDVSRRAGPPLRVPRVGRGAAFADYDDDGDCDLIMTTNNNRPVLMRNDSPGRGHFLTVELQGLHSNRNAVGSRVEVVTGRHRQILEVKAGNSYLSHSDRRLNFGLGENAKVDTLRIRWPNGSREEFRDVKADQFVTVREGRGIVRTTGARPSVTRTR